MQGLSVCLSVCLSVYLFVCLSVYLSVCPFVCSSVCLFVCLFDLYTSCNPLCRCVSISLSLIPTVIGCHRISSVCLSVCLLSVCLSVSLSVCLSVCFPRPQMPAHSDDMFVQKLYKHHCKRGGGGGGGGGHFSKPRLSTTAFCIHHYACVVEYEGEGFVEKNMDSLSPEHLSLLQSSEVGGACCLATSQ